MRQYIVDAFTDKLFHGNQAAVCVLDKWLPEELMMNITRENNFSETAFTVKGKDGYDLRWFTPGGEINLCGHATLATSFVLFNYYEKDADDITFHTMSGDLFIHRQQDEIVMDFPAYRLNETPVTEQMTRATGHTPVRAFIDRDLLLVYEDEKTIREMSPDFGEMMLLDGLGVGVTAPGKEYDCVSRFFTPKDKINEDPVTGSVHCMIAPYWAEQLGKKEIHAYQASERGGELECRLQGDRVVISGKAVLYSVGDLFVIEGKTK
jgi:PhzF family phenazine biosynthesis protein